MHYAYYMHAQQDDIGGNDLRIAATAVAHGLPVVTRNTRHYRRVLGLEVMRCSTDG